MRALAKYRYFLVRQPDQIVVRNQPFDQKDRCGVYRKIIFLILPYVSCLSLRKSSQFERHTPWEGLEGYKRLS